MRLGSPSVAIRGLRGHEGSGFWLKAGYNLLRCECLLKIDPISPKPLGRMKLDSFSNPFWPPLDPAPKNPKRYLDPNSM